MPTSAAPSKSPARVLLLLALAATLGCTEPKQPKRPVNALLITLDTTRRDALGCFGGPTAISAASNNSGVFCCDALKICAVP